MDKERKEHKYFTSLTSLKSIQRLEKEIKEIANILKKALEEERKIVIKHHNDADGIIGGYAIEKSLSLYAHKKGISHRIQKYFYSNPTYTYAESLKDWSYLNKGDILMLIDVGSSKESIEGIRRITYKGVKVIIVDHHPLEYDPHQLNVVVLNPYTTTTEVTLSAGVLCLGISEKIFSLYNKNLLGAISLYADKYYDTEEFNELLKRSKTTPEEIKKYAKVIDYEIFHTFQDYGIIDFILNRRNKEMVDSIYEQIKKTEKEILEKIMKKITHIEGKYNIFIIKYDTILNPTKYPPPGKTTGIIFEFLKEKYNEVCVIGIAGNTIIVRTNIKERSFDYILNKIKEVFKDVYIEGGGHPNAGSIKVPKSLSLEEKDIIEVIK